MTKENKPRVEKSTTEERIATFVDELIINFEETRYEFLQKLHQRKYFGDDSSPPEPIPEVLKVFSNSLDSKVVFMALKNKHGRLEVKHSYTQDADSKLAGGKELPDIDFFKKVPEYDEPYGLEDDLPEELKTLGIRSIFAVRIQIRNQIGILAVCNRRKKMPDGSHYFSHETKLCGLMIELLSLENLRERLEDLQHQLREAKLSGSRSAVKRISENFLDFLTGGLELKQMSAFDKLLAANLDAEISLLIRPSRRRSSKKESSSEDLNRFKGNLKKWHEKWEDDEKNIGPLSILALIRGHDLLSHHEKTEEERKVAKVSRTALMEYYKRHFKREKSDEQ